MNDHTFVELRTLVERAVRTSGTHRRQMREELLAHVTAVFDDELAATHDERRAMERTAERFGDPRVLTSQLQGSVSRLRVFRGRLESWLDYSENEFSYRAAARWAFRSGALACVAGLAAAAILTIALPNQRHPDSWLVVMPYAGACATSLYCMGFLFLSRWLLDAWSRRSWPEILGIAALSGSVVPMIVLIMSAAISGDLAQGLRAALEILPMSMLLGPLPVLGMAWNFAYDLRQRREWASLAVD